MTLKPLLRGTTLLVIDQSQMPSGLNISTHVFSTSESGILRWLHSTSREIDLRYINVQQGCSFVDFLAGFLARCCPRSVSFALVQCLCLNKGKVHVVIKHGNGPLPARQTGVTWLAISGVAMH